jgi:hypothetical protein
MEMHGKHSNKTVCIYIALDFINQQNDTRTGTELYLYGVVAVVLSIL